MTRRAVFALMLAASIVSVVSGFSRTIAVVEAFRPAVLEAQTKAKGHLFPPQDLGLIQAPDREQWQKPDQIMDALAIAEGSIVADLGAGGGWFTVRLARRVGPNGLVYG